MNVNVNKGTLFIKYFLPLFYTSVSRVEHQTYTLLIIKILGCFGADFGDPGHGFGAVFK